MDKRLESRNDDGAVVMLVTCLLMNVLILVASGQLVWLGLKLLQASEVTSFGF
ncbi:MAG: hypothetical protein R2684_08990 [Pyrinomonadaceae bacterium]